MNARRVWGAGWLGCGGVGEVQQAAVAPGVRLASSRPPQRGTAGVSPALASQWSVVLALMPLAPAA